MYISHYLDALPGAAETVGSFAELAVANGVRRQVLVGGRGEPESERVEEAVRGVRERADDTRSTWFAQNSARAASSISCWPRGHAPGGRYAEPFVDVDDIADIAVAALTEEGHVGDSTSSPARAC